MTGSPRWMAPEVFLRKFYGFSVDVYSFGLLLWNLCSLEIPFGHTMNLVQLESKVMRKAVRPKRLPFVPNSLNALMTRCWASNPSERPKFCEICAALERFMYVEELGTEEDLLNRTNHMLQDSIRSAT